MTFLAALILMLVCICCWGSELADWTKDKLRDPDEISCTCGHARRRHWQQIGFPYSLQCHECEREFGGGVHMTAAERDRPAREARQAEARAAAQPLPWRAHAADGSVIGIFDDKEESELCAAQAQPWTREAAELRIRRGESDPYAYPGGSVHRQMRMPPQPPKVILPPGVSATR